MREDAEYLRLALAMGLIEPNEVVAWADGLIITLDEPPIQVIDVSLAVGRPRVEIMSLLAVVPGEADLAAAAHRALGLFRQRFLAGGIPPRQAADILEAYSVWASVPEDERLSASSFPYRVHDMILGYAGSPEDLCAAITEFLDCYSANPATASTGEG